MKNQIFVNKAIFWLFMKAFVSLTAIFYLECEAFLHGTKTAYKDSFNLTSDNTDPHLGVDNSFWPKNCRPVSYDILVRHGIRNPSPKDILNIDILHKKLKTTIPLDAAMQQIIDEWAPTFKQSEGAKINSKGKEEQHNLGSRIKSLLLDESSINTLKFLSSNTNRTFESCVSFKNGILGDERKLEHKCVLRNDILRFYDTCNKYLKDVESNKVALKELALFSKTDIYLSLKQKVERLVSTSAETLINITDSELKAAYVTGAMEYIEYGDSLWLKLFDENDLKILEYATDVKSYWKKGYGYEINYHQSCPLLEDIFRGFDEIISEKRESTGVHRFGHSETLLPIFSLLGLFKDEDPPRADNYHQQHNRQYRTGKIVPFSSNIAFVLHVCENETNNSAKSSVDDKLLYPGLDLPDVYDKYMLQMLFKERPMKFPMCEHDLCPYYKVRDYLNNMIDGCDFHKICEMEHEEL